MFAVAYTSTEEVAEGQKTKHMTALNSTVASVPARECVIILTNANARTGKRGEGGWESHSNVLRACGQGRLNKNGQPLLISQKATSSLQSANRSKGQARLDYVLTKQGKC